MERERMKDSLKRKGQKNLWLHDSLEYYKDKAGVSPPIQNRPTLLVGAEEEEESLNVEEETQFCNEYQSEDDSDSEEEEDFFLCKKRNMEDDDEEDIELNVDVDDSDSDSDEIIFEDTPDNNNSKAFPTPFPTPFWFGNEEKEQLRHINLKYYEALKLEEEKKKVIRQPEPFVGRVSRTQVDNGEIFTTLDVVEIYRRKIVPPGSVMPFERKVTLLTCWSYEDGLPTKFKNLDSDQEIRMWKEKILKGRQTSVLLCLPVYGTTEYSFSVSKEPMEVTHSPSSLQPIEHHDWYQQFIPNRFQEQI